MTTSQSALKRAEEALHARQLQLQQSQRLEAIGQLAGGVAHDFNNLLTVILAYTELSLRRSEVEDSIRHNLEESKETAERVASLLRQLLALIRELLATDREQILGIDSARPERFSRRGFTSKV